MPVPRREGKLKSTAEFRLERMLIELNEPQASFAYC